MPETLLPQINPEKFGGLIKIPDVLAAARTRVANARAQVQPLMTELASMNFQAADASVIEEKIKKAVTLRSRAAAGEAELKKARSNYTEFFREITTLFTTEEKAMLEMAAGLANFQDEWEKEKIRRNREEQKRMEKELKEKNDKIQKELEKNRKAIEATESKRADLIKAFNSKTAAELPTYGETLANWMPKDLPGNYRAIMLETVAELIQLIPGRVEALKTQAEAVALRDRQKAEERQKNAKEKAEALEAEAEGKRIDAAMDVTAQAVPLAEQSKGVRKKMIYVPATVGQLNKLIHSYILNDIPKMKFEQAAKTFKFAITSANIRLNQGEVIEGVPTEEEVKTVTASISE